MTNTRLALVTDKTMGKLQKRVASHQIVGLKNIRKGGEKKMKMENLRKAFSILAIVALFAIPAMSQDEEIVVASVTLPEVCELTIVPLTATWTGLLAPSQGWVIFDEGLLDLNMTFQCGGGGVDLLVRMDPLQNIINGAYQLVPPKFRLTFDGGEPVVMSDVDQVLRNLVSLGGSYDHQVVFEYSNSGQNHVGEHTGNIYFTLALI